MDEPIPTDYFTNIAYNSQFYTQPNGISLTVGDERYLKRIVGNHTSNATSTSFINTLFSGGLNSTGTITGPLINCTNISNSGSYTGNNIYGTAIQSVNNINCGGLNSTGIITGPLINCTNISNSGSYTGNNIYGTEIQSVNNLNCGGLNSTNTITGPLINCTNISNSGSYTGNNIYGTEIQSVNNLNCGGLNSTNTITGPLINCTNISNSGSYTGNNIYGTEIQSVNNLNCGGLVSTNTITGPLISASSINNSGDFTGSYLNLNNNTISAGYQAGQTNQGLKSVAIGYQAGRTNQGDSSVAIGESAGRYIQGKNSVAIGYQAGYTLQNTNSIAIGVDAGYFTQSFASVAIGYQAGYAQQNNSSVAIGLQAAYTGQGLESVAIGNLAGYTRQHDYAIAIGSQAGQTNQGDYSVCIGFNSESSGDYSVAFGCNAVSVGSHNISIGTTNETINLNGDTTCKSLLSTSTQDSSIDTPSLGSIITNGGIKVSKNIYGQNFQTNNNSNLNGLISRTNRGGDVYIGTLIVDYLTYNLSSEVSGGRFYSMSCNSGFGGVINIMTPLLLRITSSVGRSGLATTSYTFSVSVTNINLVVNKNGSYYSTIPMSKTVNNTTFDFIYTGTTTGLQSISVYAYMTPVYTQFIVIPDTLNTTDDYDFYVTANIAYTSNVTVPYTSGSNSFFLYANDTFSGLSYTRVNCNLSPTPNTSGYTVSPELYCDTVCPLSFGTSNTNILSCNNIKMLSTGVISKEMVNSHDISTYQSYLTIRETGVYLYNSASGVLVSYPIYYTTLLYSNFFSSAPTSGNLNTYNVANGGGLGVGLYGSISLSNNDDAYLVYPEYGIKVYTASNFGGSLVIDYYNSSATINFVRAVTNNTGDSCKLYYRGEEITSY